MDRFRLSLMLLFPLGGGRIFSSYVCLTYFSKISFSSLLSPCHQNCQPQLCRPSPPSRLCQQYHNCGILNLNDQFCRWFLKDILAKLRIKRFGCQKMIGKEPLSVIKVFSRLEIEVFHNCFTQLPKIRKKPSEINNKISIIISFIIFSPH